MRGKQHPSIGAPILPGQICIRTNVGKLTHTHTHTRIPHGHIEVGQQQLKVPGHMVRRWNHKHQ